MSPQVCATTERTALRGPKVKGSLGDEVSAVGAACAWGGGTWEISACPRFCCKLKTTRKNKVWFFLKKGQCGPELCADFPVLSLQTRGLPGLEKGGAAGGLRMQGAHGGVGRP